MTKRDLVHRVEEEYPISVMYRDGYSQVQKVATSYFVDDTSLVKVTAHKKTGLNMHTNNQWWRWVNYEVSYVELRNGKFITRSKIDKQWSSHLGYWQLDRDTEWTQRFEWLFRKPFSFYTIHPLAPHYDINNAPMATGFAPSLKEQDLRAQVAHLFGKTRVRRDLMRAVGQSYPNAIMLAREFRGLVPIDWIVKFLMDNPRDLRSNRLQPYKGGFRRHLYGMQPRVYRYLLRSGFQDHDMWFGLNDVLMMRLGAGYEIPTDGFRTFSELHDTFFAQARAYHLRNPTPITQQTVVPPTELWTALHNSRVGNYKFVMPEESTMLQLWGQQMRNCIGGYAHTLVNEKRRRELGGIYEGDKLVANFEIYDGRLQQLLGKCNQALPVGVRRTLEKHFKSHNIVVTQEYWGARD